MNKFWLFPILLAAGLLQAEPPPVPSTRGMTQPPVPGPAASQTGSGVTLAECYQKAIQVSETLAISEEDIKQLEAVYKQELGSVLPNVSWQMTQLWQDSSGVDQSSGGVQGTLTRRRIPESYFQVKQPLFHGLREFNALKGFKAATKATQYQRDQAILNLLGDVADVFYIALDLQQEMAVLASQRTLNNDRLDELERRVRLGKSRDSEVLSTQVEVASLDAQIEDTKQRLAVARHLLTFLTEVPADVPLVENRALTPLPTVDAAIGKAHANRPDLRAAEQSVIGEKYRLSYAKGGFFPILDATGRYYTQRVGIYEDIKWDAMLSLDVPIFTGFRTKGEVEQARSQLVVADLEMARLMRQIRREVETAHENLRYTVSQVELYGKAVELASRNYKIQQQEYKLGLINNLQVLDVLNNLQDLKLRQIRSDASMRINDIHFLIATGQTL